MLSKANFQKIAPIAGIVLVFGFTLWIGVRGIDFGNHWDEFRYIATSETALRNHSWLPGWYNYPSLTWYLAQPAIRSGDPEDAYLRGRCVFLCISVSVVLFVFFAACEAGISKTFSLFAAAITGLSFEFSYHSRWMAPDAVMAVFAMLTLWLCLCYLRKGQQPILIASAFCAGMAVGTKYPGVLIFLPVLISVFMQRNTDDKFRFAFRVSAILRSLSLVGVMLLAFFMTTPGPCSSFRFLVNIFCMKSTITRDHNLGIRYRVQVIISVKCWVIFSFTCNPVKKSALDFSLHFRF